MDQDVPLRAVGKANDAFKAAARIRRRNKGSGIDGGLAVLRCVKVEARRAERRHMLHHAEVWHDGFQRDDARVGAEAQPPARGVCAQGGDAAVGLAGDGFGHTAEAAL